MNCHVNRSVGTPYAPSIRTKHIGDNRAAECVPKVAVSKLTALSQGNMHEYAYPHYTQNCITAFVRIHKGYILPSSHSGLNNIVIFNYSQPPTLAVSWKNCQL